MVGWNCITQVDPSEPSEPDSGLSDLPKTDLGIPEDPILNFVNSQHHNSEDLDLALQVYQAWKVLTSQDSTQSPERTINHHYTYHIAQDPQHGSLVDRGTNGGFAGSDVRILHMTPFTTIRANQHVLSTN